MTAALRKGDVVSVKGIVLHEPFDSGGEMKVQVRIEPYHDVFVQAADVTMVRPEFKVGDKVQWIANKFEVPLSGRVLSIANDHLWIDRGDGNFATVWANNATRMADDPGPIDRDGESAAPPQFVIAGQILTKAAETLRAMKHDGQVHLEPGDDALAKRELITHVHTNIATDRDEIMDVTGMSDEEIVSATKKVRQQNGWPDDSDPVAEVRRAIVGAETEEEA